MNRVEPRLYVEMVCHWIKNHPDSWRKLRRIVRNQIRLGRMVTRDRIFILAEQQGLTISEINELKRDHNAWSVLTRYMVMLEPSFARNIRFKDCGIDTVNLDCVWRENVNQGTTFLASSWTNAKELCAMQDAAA